MVTMRTILHLTSILLTILRKIRRRSGKASNIMNPEISKELSPNHSSCGPGSKIIVILIALWIISLAATAVLTHSWTRSRTRRYGQYTKVRNTEAQCKEVQEVQNTEPQYTKAQNQKSNMDAYIRRIYLSTHSVSFCFVPDRHATTKNKGAMLISKLDFVNLNARPAIFSAYCDHFIRGEDDKCAALLPSMTMAPNEKQKITYDELYDWFKLQREEDATSLYY